MSCGHRRTTRWPDVLGKMSPNFLKSCQMYGAFGPKYSSCMCSYFGLTRKGCCHTAKFVNSDFQKSPTIIKKSPNLVALRPPPSRRQKLVFSQIALSSLKWVSPTFSTFQDRELGSNPSDCLFEELKCCPTTMVSISLYCDTQQRCLLLFCLPHVYHRDRSIHIER